MGACFSTKIEGGGGAVRGRCKSVAERSSSGWRLGLGLTGITTHLFFSAGGREGFLHSALDAAAMAASQRAYGLREWRRAPVLAALEQLAASAPWPRVSTLEQLERAFEAWKTAVTPSLTATRIHTAPPPFQRRTGARHGSCPSPDPITNPSPPTGSLL